MMKNADTCNILCFLIILKPFLNADITAYMPKPDFVCLCEYSVSRKVMLNNSSF